MESRLALAEETGSRTHLALDEFKRTAPSDDEDVMENEQFDEDRRRPLKSIVADGSPWAVAVIIAIFSFARRSPS